MDQFFESLKDLWLAPVGGALISLSFSYPTCSTEYTGGVSSTTSCENLWGMAAWTPTQTQSGVMAFIVATVFWGIAAAIRDYRSSHAPTE